LIRTTELVDNRGEGFLIVKVTETSKKKQQLHCIGSALS
jgi:hypothetical protein